MSVKITWQYLLAFAALNMILGELHEQAHIQTGFLICGCYGVRDFNVWTTCANCTNSNYSFLATVAGPLLSYLVYGFCTFQLLRGKDVQLKKFYLAALFAMLPFARIFTAWMGGGDEKTVLVYLLGDTFSVTSLKIAAAVFVTAICLPPIWIAIQQLPLKKRWWYVLGFNIGPLIFGMLWQRAFLNKLLAAGILEQPILAGTPLLIALHFVCMLFLLLRFRKALIG